MLYQNKMRHLVTGFSQSIKNYAHILKSSVMDHLHMFQKPSICYVVNEEENHWTLLVSVNASLALQPISKEGLLPREPICGCTKFDSLARDRAGQLGIPEVSAFQTFLNFAMTNIQVVTHALPEFNMTYDHFGRDNDVHGLAISCFCQLQFDDVNQCY